MFTNHYGVTIDLDVPVPGVIDNNALESLDWAINEGEWLYPDRDQQTDDEGELVFDEDGEPVFEGDDDDDYDPGEAQEVLIGDWIQDEEGLWEPDRENGEYAGISGVGSYGPYTTVIVWSKYTARYLGCSPCYPGQADLDSPSKDGFLAYTLPPDMWPKDKEDA